jgi:hypothetical protein
VLCDPTFGRTELQLVHHSIATATPPSVNAPNATSQRAQSVDWVLSAGPARAMDSSVVGEAGNENVDLTVDPWPSDHRGVVSTSR